MSAVSPWLAAMRIARREALRSKGRSVLILLMIIAPVSLITFADVTVRSTQASPLQQMQKELGGADLSIEPGFDSQLIQNPEGLYDTKTIANGKQGDAVPALAKPADLATLFPTGSKVVADRQSTVRVKTKAGIGQLYLRGLDYRQSTGAGLYKQLEGRAPTGPSEVALSRSAVKSIGATIGQPIELPAAKQSLTVVGIIENPRDLKSLIGVTTDLPTSVLAAEAEVPTYRVALSAPLSWNDVKRLNAMGILVKYPEMLINRPPASEIEYNPPTYGGRLQEYAFVALIGGLAGLEICLLAGTAFAVGARRQRRSLALVLAGGGNRSQVRNIVLASGIVLGTVGALIGIALGIGFTIVARPWIETTNNARFINFALAPADLLVIALLGLSTAVLSAILPARSAARINVPAALAGRPDPISGRGRHRLSILGTIAFIIGVGVLVASATRREIYGVLLGAIVVEVALVMLTSTLVGFIGRFGKRLPLTPRMALRDAVRNRPRTTPAIAAIMAGVAGATSISMFTLAYSVNDREDYQPRALPGQVVVPLSADYDTPGGGNTRADELMRTLPDLLPVKSMVAPKTLAPAACASPAGINSRCEQYLHLDIPKTSPCYIADNTDEGAYERARANPLCGAIGAGAIYVADEAVVQAVLGPVPRSALEALANGGAIATSSGYVSDGKIALVSTTFEDTEAARHTIPAQIVTVRDGDKPGSQLASTAFVSRATADRLGLGIASPTQIIVSTTQTPTKEQEEKVQALVEGAGIGDVYVERGYQNGYRIGLLILAIAGTVLALLATAISTGLALADGAADQATLSAVGASPSFRKRMSAFQALTVSILGIGLGLISGLLPGAAFAWVSRYKLGADGEFMHQDVPWLQVIPWTSIAMLMIVVPLLAGSAAWLFTRSRVRVTRRTV